MSAFISPRRVAMSACMSLRRVAMSVFISVRRVAISAFHVAAQNPQVLTGGEVVHEQVGNRLHHRHRHGSHRSPPSGAAASPPCACRTIPPCRLLPRYHYRDSSRPDGATPLIAAPSAVALQTEEAGPAADPIVGTEALAVQTGYLTITAEEEPPRHRCPRPGAIGPRARRRALSRLAGRGLAREPRFRFGKIPQVPSGPRIVKTQPALAHPQLQAEHGARRLPRPVGQLPRPAAADTPPPPAPAPAAAAPGSRRSGRTASTPLTPSERYSSRLLTWSSRRVEREVISSHEVRALRFLPQAVDGAVGAVRAHDHEDVGRHHRLRIALPVIDEQVAGHVHVRAVAEVVAQRLDGVGPAWCAGDRSPRWVGRRTTDTQPGREPAGLSVPWAILPLTARYHGGRCAFGFVPCPGNAPAGAHASKGQQSEVASSARPVAQLQEAGLRGQLPGAEASLYLIGVDFSRDTRNVTGHSRSLTARPRSQQWIMFTWSARKINECVLDVFSDDGDITVTVDGHDPRR